MAQQNAAGWETPYKFTGKELDDATGLYYFGARYYDPRLSYFWGVDPLAEKYPGWSPYNYTANNPIRYVDSNGMDWYLNNETGKYKYFEGSGMHDGYSNVGAFKVLYNQQKNQIESYFQDNPEMYESIDMSNIIGNDRAAKFSMIAAELGGPGGSTQFEAYVIGASMENRLASLNSGNYSKFDIKNSGLVSEFKENGGYLLQDLFTTDQYNAANKKSYLNFGYGHNARFNGMNDKNGGSRLFDANSALAYTYNALDDSASKLISKFNFTNSFSIMGYAHKGSPSLYRNYNISFNKKLAPNLNKITGSHFWKR